MESDNRPDRLGMKVGLPRGVALSKFEMQNFEPLKDQVDITAYMLSTNVFPVDGLNIPVKILRFPDESWLGGRTSLLRKYFTRLRGLRYYMYGLEKELWDKDIIHSWEADYGFSFQSAKVKEKTGARLISTHWNLIPLGAQGQTDTKRYAYVRERIDLYLAVTVAASRCLLQERVPEGKIRVLPMGVDQQKFRPGRKDPRSLEKYGLKEEDLIVLFLGRYVREKGVYDLLAAIDSLKDRKGGDWERVKYLFVGQGPEETRMKQFRREKGLDSRVIIAGSVCYDIVPAVHRLADVFVIPSLPLPGVKEQFGYALLESMACGAAVIVSDCGALPEISGDAALVFPSAKAAVLAGRLSALIEDASLRRSLAGKARRRAEGLYDSRKVAAQLLQIYRAVT